MRSAAGSHTCGFRQGIRLNLIIMVQMNISAIAAAMLVSTSPAFAEVSRCACDISNPETLAPRECALCKEAEAQPAAQPVFFLKDNNPRKPNRWLALPRAHGKGGHPFAEMTA